MVISIRKTSMATVGMTMVQVQTGMVAVIVIIVRADVVALMHIPVTIVTAARHMVQAMETEMVMGVGMNELDMRLESRPRR